MACHVPTTWREVKVVFIPKAGGKSEQLPKSYRPISLSSFFLKTMEKLLDSYIRDSYLLMNPIHRFQFAYQPGKSTVTAIHQVTTLIEKAIDANYISLCAFIDIQGAFDNTSYGAIDLALYRKGVPQIIRKWILEMLSSRVIKLDLGGSSKTIRATRGCPQGGVLSPLLWTLVIDELLEELNNLGFRTYGYADDLAEIYAILICSNECLRRRVRNNKIFVMSDSQAALRALSSYEVRSGVVMDCWTSLNELGTHNELTLCWVPSHEGHAGNERADCLANRGARRPFIGPEPANDVVQAPFRDVKMVKSAFKKRVMTLSYENMNEECLIPEIFLKEAYTPFMQKVKVFLKEHYALKYNIELHALYAKPNLDDLENTPLEVKTFQTKMEEILNISDFESTFSNKIMNIRKKSEEFQEKDSGWTLVQLIKVYLNLNKYQPLKGSSYIELPKKLHLKYACINVKNADEFCFKWAIISAIADFKKDAGRPSKYNVNIEAENITVKGNSLNFKGLCFPLKVKDISIFEINNPNISINVFGYDESIKLIVGPYYKSKVKRSKHINLLFLQKNIAHNTICHYIWIKNISRLIRSQQTKHESKIFVCDDCLQHFHHQDKLDLHQKICSQLVFRVPTPDKSILEFKNYKNKFDVPFVIYADSECIFENIQTCIPNGNKSSTTLVDRHIPYAFSYFIKSNINNNDLSHKLRHFKGIDAAKLFVETLVADVKSLNDHYLKEIIPMTPLTEQENLDYALNDICHICFKPIANEIKVRDHCHLSGKYRGPAHNSCNLNAKTPKLFPVIFHNFSSYDCHLFVKELNNIDDGPINIIPLNKELYISLSKTIKSDKGNNIEIRFLDSYRFMPSSLDSLIQNLTKDELKIVKEFYSDDENQFNLLIRKGVFPYNYLNSLEKLKETCLPSIDDFYNKLTDSKCSIEDYTHAQEVWSKFECKTLEDYLMVYLKSDVLLLADVFENFRSVCKSIYKLDPCHYYTAPGLSWDAMLKITEIKLDLLTDIEMIRFLQKGIRGGIVQCSQRYSSANNKYLSDYDEKLPSKYLTYLDANNLYGWAM
ncbi:uncharacterized protein LOC135956640 [Calliphora vicina]|uniref:uncharacterized protein LOC135956640 n=1 Tax=Calliphora vicina TaxID=7373 RepID=UPI00325A7D59